MRGDRTTPMTLSPRPFRSFIHAMLILATFAGSMAVTSPVAAAVRITFFNHELGDRFPHAFVRIEGMRDDTGESIDTNFGFTARSVTPAILMGAVDGKIESSKPAYVADSVPQFALTLTDAQLDRVLALRDAWRDRPQPSYRLNRANCVHFVMEVAAALDLRVNRESRFFKKPRSFLEEVRALNPHLAKPAQNP